MAKNKNTIQLNDLVHIDLEKIRTVEIAEGDNDQNLNSLGLKIYNQSEIERGIFSQVDQAVEKCSLQSMKLKLTKELSELEEALKYYKIKFSSKNEQSNYISFLKFKKYEQSHDKLERIEGIKSKIIKCKAKLEEIELALLPKDLYSVTTTDNNQKELVIDTALETKEIPILKKEEYFLEDHILLKVDNLVSKPSAKGVGTGIIKDDGNLTYYKKRLKKLKNGMIKWVLHKYEQDIVEQNNDDNLFININSDYKIPQFIWHQLFSHQKDAIKWLWGLHSQSVGGILGDEMGLGKTIQVIAFFAGLATSRTLPNPRTTFDEGPVPNKLDTITDVMERYHRLPGPCLVVCPATLMNQWLQEFHFWWPFFRVAILHQTGSFDKSKKTRLLKDIAGSGSILITTYSSLVLNRTLLSSIPWYYIILDEGHKIRNNESKVCRAAKAVSLAASCHLSTIRDKTRPQGRRMGLRDTEAGTLASSSSTHPLILSGTPIQNNMKELWTLFDFVYPGKLGTMQAFMENFAVPIVAGGYANASQIQITTAYRCACILRESISPYLLRRTKSDATFLKEVAIPGKNEQVLFCQLTNYQRRVYLDYLSSVDVDEILRGKLKIFKGLITLRKLCNHPDLVQKYDPITASATSTDLDEKSTVGAEVEAFGYWRRSGKMIVLKELLKIWAKQGNRVLIFGQTRQILNIIEKFITERRYRYLRLDGTSPIKSRQSTVDTFNTDPLYFIFLLTTRVGGLGLNLTGANKVVIFDPDWNPCVDGQAKERAWRIGQTKDVTIYRLLVADDLVYWPPYYLGYLPVKTFRLYAFPLIKGTVEEKIYHRQIFKQYITNRILNNPKLNNRVIFKMNDLKELFSLTLPDHGDNGRALHLPQTSKLKIHTTNELNSLPRTRRPLRSSPRNRQNSTTSSNNDFEVDTNETQKVTSRDDSQVSDKVDLLAKARLLSRQLVSGLSTTDIDKGINGERTKPNQRRKRRRYATFEGKVVSHLNYQEPFKSSQADVKKSSDNGPKDAGEGYVLERILKNSHVAGSLSHDTVMKSHTRFATGAIDDQAEADKIALAAIQNVRASRKDYFDVYYPRGVTIPNRPCDTDPKPPPSPQNASRVKVVKARVAPLTQEQLFFTQLDSDPIRRYAPNNVKPSRQNSKSVTCSENKTNVPIIFGEPGNGPGLIVSPEPGIFSGTFLTQETPATMGSSFLLGKIAERNAPPRT